MKKILIAVIGMAGLILACSEGETIAWQLITTSAGIALLLLSSRMFEKEQARREREI